MERAIAREKALKEWKRAWKLDMLETFTRVGGTCTRRSSGWIPVFAGMTSPLGRLSLVLSSGFEAYQPIESLGKYRNP